MVSDQSVGALFLGGVGPGLLMTAALMLTVWIVARRRGFPTEAAIPWRDYPRVIGRGIPPLLMPGILLGGIYGGVFTPTEAAAVAALYALFLAAAVYRVLGVRKLFEILIDTVRSSAVIAMIIAGAFLFNYIVATEQIPNAIAAWLSGFDISPTAFLLLVSLLFLAFGCFLDATTMLLVLVPIILPSMQAMGIDLIHFGVVVVGQHDDRAGDPALRGPAVRHQRPDRHSPRRDHPGNVDLHRHLAGRPAAHDHGPGHRAVAAQNLGLLKVLQTEGPTHGGGEVVLDCR